MEERRSEGWRERRREGRREGRRETNKKDHNKTSEDGRRRNVKTIEGGREEKREVNGIYRLRVILIFHLHD